MSPVVHGMIAWLLVIILLKNINDRRLAVIAGVAPDIDGFFILINMDLYITYHHTFTHSFIFGIPIALTAAGFGATKLRTFIVALGTFSLHLLADIIGTNWSVYPFYPFTTIELSIAPYLSDFTIYWIINPIAFIIILIAIIFVVYIKEVSPLEFISERLDQLIVNYYLYPLKYKCELCGKRAFVKCSSCGRKVCAVHSKSIIKPKCSQCK